MTNVTTKTQKSDLSLSWQMCIAVMISAAAIMLPDMAFAANNDTPFGNIFCTVVGWFTGNTGKGLATIAITIIGIGALLGKVSWGMALIVGVGIAIVFGAAGIIDAIDSTDNIAEGCVQDASVFR
jgi:type IV secretion system protein VirB2